MGVQARLAPAMTVRPPAKGAFELRSTAGGVGALLVLVDRHSLGVLKLRLHRMTLPSPFTYWTSPPTFSMGLTVARRAGRRTSRDMYDAEDRAFGRIGEPAHELEGDPAGLPRRVHREGLRVAVGLEVELHALLAVEEEGDLRRGVVTAEGVVGCTRNRLLLREVEVDFVGPAVLRVLGVR